MTPGSMRVGECYRVACDELDEFPYTYVVTDADEHHVTMVLLDDGGDGNVVPGLKAHFSWFGADALEWRRVT